MATSSTLSFVKTNKTGKRKFIDEKDGENFSTFEERKTKTTRPEQQSSLWKCTSKIFGGCQEIKNAAENKYPATTGAVSGYYLDKETCDLNCGLPGDIIGEISGQFSGSSTRSNLRQTGSLLKDLEKVQEEKNEQRLLKLLDEYLHLKRNYEETKTKTKNKIIDSMKEMFKLGQGKNFFNLVLKKVLTENNKLTIINVNPFSYLISQLSKSFQLENVDWISLLKFAINSSYEKKEKVSKDMVFSLSVLFGYANNVSPPLVDSFFSNHSHLDKATTILDNYLKDINNYNSILDGFELEEDPLELYFPLYSTTFLRYYISRSEFQAKVYVGRMLRNVNRDILSRQELIPTSEKTEVVLQKMMNYRENQAILDSHFPVDDQGENLQDYEEDEE